MDAVEQVLTQAQWRARAERHRNRMLHWTQPHHERQRRDEKHPVLDFLFTCYGPGQNQLLLPP
ncbi:hypothetical protein ACOQFL_18750 [Actinopolyspora sp. H202]|uniref:hypothetical protein n=1 Tax=Actinopolyspora sp. H202 TaxID=1500456 RepID=UPI003EE72763